MNLRRLVLAASSAAAVLGVLAVATPAPAAKPGPGSCATVRCAGCPDGQHLSLKWPNCCECLPNR